MTEPHTALSDPVRLAALAATGLLDTPAEERFDRHTRLAVTLTGAPVALFALAGRERQFLKSAAALTGQAAGERIGSDSEWFCRQVVELARPLVVTDARSDPRLQANPGTGPRAIAYAGFPVRADTGQVIGSFAALGHEPRSWSPADLALLDGLAIAVATEVALTSRSETLARTESERDRLATELRLVRERMPAGMVLLAPDLTIGYANPAMERLFGFGDGELAGGDCAAVLFATADAASREDVRRRLASGSALDTVVPCRTRDGRAVTCRWSATPLQDGSGRLTGILAMVTDATPPPQAQLVAAGGQERTIREDTAGQALQESEARLRQAQKMEAIGQLAGGVAHDFNNLLTAIYGNAELLQLQLPASAPALEEVREILRATERATFLTRGLLAFSRKQILQPSALDLNQVVSGVSRLLQRLIGEDILLETELDPEPVPILADASQLEQVLVNLVVNARDAMPSGGSIRIRTGRRGNLVTLVVSDTGTGMSEETQQRIFEPFFTTKPAGKGTGLGLSTVLGIVTQSGGTIGCASIPGKGSTFTITLPMNLDPKGATQRTSGPVRLPRGNERILVVEDEVPVRRMVRRVLERLGYLVLEARHGGDALRLWEDSHGAVDLVLTDLVMPEMSGQELVTALRARSPGLRVLLMSGYTDKAIPTDVDGLIEKPFLAEALARRVREVLDRGGA